ncbi:hypothetical protein PGT21_034049 [Puccinia graminis f. sp. tritici]|uniref:Uncharacterized protein n=1 Tax=Puccinia graminis f. sp. tritici TaxID=56615 RepID=A0A5B0MN43_PUCGR|nr:hypothetical protein PGT21_034049 [Puccinia graminis f. sp. tritici]
MSPGGIPPGELVHNPARWGGIPPNKLVYIPARLEEPLPTSNPHTSSLRGCLLFVSV